MPDDPVVLFLLFQEWEDGILDMVDAAHARHAAAAAADHADAAAAAARAHTERVAIQKDAAAAAAAAAADDNDDTDDEAEAPNHDHVFEEHKHRGTGGRTAPPEHATAHAELRAARARVLAGLDDAVGDGQLAGHIRELEALADAGGFVGGLGGGGSGGSSGRGGVGVVDATGAMRGDEL